jgi:hypothetical protein
MLVAMLVIMLIIVLVVMLVIMLIIVLVVMLVVMLVRMLVAMLVIMLITQTQTQTNRQVQLVPRSRQAFVLFRHPFFLLWSNLTPGVIVLIKKQKPRGCFKNLKKKHVHEFKSW